MFFFYGFSWSFQNLFINVIWLMDLFSKRRFFDVMFFNTSPAREMNPSHGRRRMRDVYPFHYGLGFERFHLIFNFPLLFSFIQLTKRACKEQSKRIKIAFVIALIAEIIAFEWSINNLIFYQPINISVQVEIRLLVEKLYLKMIYKLLVIPAFTLK